MGVDYKVLCYNLDPRRVLFGTLGTQGAGPERTVKGRIQMYMWRLFD